MKKIILSVLMLSIASAYCQKAFKVNQYGKGQPVIIITGNTSDNDKWNKTIDNLKANYELYIITFTKKTNESINTNSISKIKKELVKYIDENHLNNLVIIGEGIGAYISLQVASEQPFLFSKIVIINTIANHIKDESGFTKDISKINIPVLILINKENSKDVSQEVLKDEYNSLLNKKIVAASNTNLTEHDYPAWFREQIKNFLLNGFAN
jgi:hypothetical protein